MLCIEREENSIKPVACVSGVILRVKQPSKQLLRIVLIFAVLHLQANCDTHGKANFKKDQIFITLTVLRWSK